MATPETEQSLAQAEAAEVREMSLPAPEAALSAERALEMLRQGQEIRNVRIERLHLSGDFTAPVTMKGVVLVQPHFDRAVFQKDVVLVHCVLDRPEFSGKCEFQGNWMLSESTLLKAHINQVTIRGTFSCNHAVFRGRLLVTRSRFEGRISFWEAHFRCWAEFKGCEFLGEADFRSFHAEQGFVLNKDRFAADVLFRGVTIAKKWEANGTRFGALLDFSKAKLHDFVYLENIEQDPDQRFAFLNAVADRLLVRTEQVQGRLASEEKGDYAQAAHEYALLKRSFQSLHRYEQEDWAFYRFKINQRRCVSRSWLRPWTKLLQFSEWLFLDLGCGYCTNPYRAVGSALVIILFFAIVYMAGVESLHIDPAKRPFVDQPVESFANRATIGMYLSVSVFVSGLSGIRDLAQGWMNLPLILESLLGTLLWGLFIVAFSRKVIR